VGSANIEGVFKFEEDSRTTPQVTVGVIENDPARGLDRGEYVVSEELLTDGLRDEVA
jgi:hypothetical protein